MMNTPLDGYPIIEIAYGGQYAYYQPYNSVHIKYNTYGPACSLIIKVGDNTLPIDHYDRLSKLSNELKRFIVPLYTDRQTLTWRLLIDGTQVMAVSIKDFIPTPLLLYFISDLTDMGMWIGNMTTTRPVSLQLEHMRVSESTIHLTYSIVNNLQVSNSGLSNSGLSNSGFSFTASNLLDRFLYIVTLASDNERYAYASSVHIGNDISSYQLYIGSRLACGAIGRCKDGLVVTKDGYYMRFDKRKELYETEDTVLYIPLVSDSDLNEEMVSSLLDS